jgi:hypothetical protein
MVLFEFNMPVGRRVGLTRLYLLPPLEWRHPGNPEATAAAEFQRYTVGRRPWAVRKSSATSTRS